MKKALLPILAAITVSACSTTTIPERSSYNPYSWDEKISDLRAKGYISKEEMLAECEGKSKQLNPVSKENYDKILQKVKTLAWKDPWSVKITDVVYASPYERCRESISYYNASSLDETKTYAGASYKADPYPIKGKVYAKNGYGAYDGATAFFIYDDGRVDTNEYTLKYTPW